MSKEIQYPSKGKIMGTGPQIKNIYTILSWKNINIIS